MKYLVDANVLSEGTKPEPNSNVVQWLRQHEREIVVDPIVLGEIQYGIYLLPHGSRRAALEQWFLEGVSLIQCLSWTGETGLVWAKLLADLRRTGRAMPVKDSLIAASALFHGLAVATHNEVNFKNAGVAVVDPFDGPVAPDREN